MKRVLFSFLFYVYVCFASAAEVDSVLVFSSAMNTQVKALVIVPDGVVGDLDSRFPVVYLLHGYGGSERHWLIVKPDLAEIADREGIIFVLPDGRNSWYINSPFDGSSQYETFISTELIAFIDDGYRTIADRRGRAITGLSMGGHGALFNAFGHPDIFGAVGSTSGAVDIRLRGDNFGLVRLLGEITEHPEHWESNSVLNLVSRLNDGDLAIYIDCGREDFCFALNESLHVALNERGISHDYTTRKGNHELSYWRNSIDYQILFFCKFFRDVSD
jgi:S-formylglutathione hydrolase FrmB